MRWELSFYPVLEFILRKAIEQLLSFFNHRACPVLPRCSHVFIKALMVVPVLTQRDLEFKNYQRSLTSCLCNLSPHSGKAAIKTSRRVDVLGFCGYLRGWMKTKG